ncbi:hypothetical protein GCM10009804_47790 [Kribbella hippodromi]|uniref:Uncharacterized protein n=1 Tax=Kribbella hippodromi TaxID=434347 RepID=A0ABN2DTF3_9ACTN
MIFVSAIPSTTRADKATAATVARSSEGLTGPPQAFHYAIAHQSQLSLDILVTSDQRSQSYAYSGSEWTQGGRQHVADSTGILLIPVAPKHCKPNRDPPPTAQETACYERL